MQSDNRYYQKTYDHSPSHFLDTTHTWKQCYMTILSGEREGGDNNKFKKE